MLIKHNVSYMNRHRFRCSGTSRKNFKGILNDTNFSSPRIAFKEYRYIPYMWNNKSSSCDMYENSEMSVTTFIRVEKKNFHSLKKRKHNSVWEKIGGIEKAVQNDETISFKGRLHTNPSDVNGSIKGAIWLVVCVEGDTNDLRIEFVPNGELETMKGFSRRNVKNKTTVKSDSHKSYPGSVDFV